MANWAVRLAHLLHMGFAQIIQNDVQANTAAFTYTALQNPSNTK